MSHLCASLAAAVAVFLAGGGPAAAQETKVKKEKAKQDPERLRISGFISVWYKFRVDENDDGQREPDVFRLGKVRVRASGRLHDHVGYTVEIDPRSPTVAGLARDAYISIHDVIPGHEIRAGQQKTQFGYENRQSSTELYTITRSELSESLGRGVTLRDIGIGIVGRVKVAKGVRIEDAVTVVNGAGFGVQADDTQMKNVWGRVGVRYKRDASDLTLRFGVSGAIGDQMTEADPGPPPQAPERFEFRRMGADATVDHPWFFAAAELARGWDEVPADSGETETGTAYYLLVAGKTPWKVGPILRYDAWDAEEFVRVTAGAYWGEPDDDLRGIVQYEHFEDEAGVHDGRVMAQGLVRF